MKAYGITVLRVTVGAIYLLQAYRLLVGRTAGLPDPPVALWLLIAVQGLGGLVVLAGLFTRAAAAANTVVSALTLARDFGGVPLGALEFPALLLAATVALLFLGSGPIAVRPSR